MFKMRVLQRANQNRWNVFTLDFIRARQHIIDEALSTPISNREWAIQAANACNAVGVCDNCAYLPGDANNNGYANGQDVIYLNNYLKGLSPALNTCSLPYENPVPWINFYAAADYNGNCVVNGIDVTYAVNYYQGREPDIKWCPHYTPGNP